LISISISTVSSKVLFAVAGGWILSAILTATGNIPPGSRARTDLRSSVLSESSWFRVPYPGNIIIGLPYHPSINTRSTIFYKNGK
jgi:hypothetical protein